MDFIKLVVARYFTEVLGMKYLEEKDDVLWFEEGLNKVAVGVYVSDFYEEGELYKRINVLMGLGAVKTFLAVLPDALPYVDARHFKSIGLGLVVVELDKGVEGVYVKIFPRARQIQSVAAVADHERLVETLKAQLTAYVESQLRRIENALYERLKNYIDQRLAEFKPQPQPEPKATPPGGQQPQLAANEWVRILRSKGGG